MTPGFLPTLNNLLTLLNSRVASLYLFENKFPVVKTGCQPSGQVHQISNPIRKIGMPAATIMLFIVLFSCYRNLNVGSSALSLPCLDLCICDCVLCLCLYLSYVCVCDMHLLSTIFWQFCIPKSHLSICDCVLYFFVFVICVLYLLCICFIIIFVISTCSRQSFDSFASQSRIALFGISSSHWSASSCCSRSEHRCPTGFWPSGIQRDGILGRFEAGGGWLRDMNKWTNIWFTW